MALNAISLSNTNTWAELCALHKTSLRHEDTVWPHSANISESVAESTDSVEVDFFVDRRLINSSDGARLRMTVRRVGFIEEFIENSKTAGRVASALELSVEILNSITYRQWVGSSTMLNRSSLGRHFIGRHLIARQLNGDSSPGDN